MLTIKTEILEAVREVNAAFYGLPPEVRDRVRINDWEALEDQLQEADQASDRQAAVNAVDAWRSRWITRLEEVGRAEPLAGVAR